MTGVTGVLEADRLRIGPEADQGGSGADLGQIRVDLGRIWERTTGVVIGWRPGGRMSSPDRPGSRMPETREFHVCNFPAAPSIVDRVTDGRAFTASKKALAPPWGDVLGMHKRSVVLM